MGGLAEADLKTPIQFYCAAASIMGPKKDKKNRLVVDYHRTNKKLEKTCYLLREFLMWSIPWKVVRSS